MFNENDRTEPFGVLVSLGNPVGRCSSCCRAVLKNHSLASPYMCTPPLAHSLIGQGK